MCDPKAEGGRRCGKSSTPAYRRDYRAQVKAAKAVAVDASLSAAAVTTQGTPLVSLSAAQVREWVTSLDASTRVDFKVALVDGSTGRAEAELRTAARHYVFHDLSEGQPVDAASGNAAVDQLVDEAFRRYEGKGLDDDDIEHFLDKGDYSADESWQLGDSRSIEVVRVTDNDWVTHHLGRDDFEGPQFERFCDDDSAQVAVIEWAQSEWDVLNVQDIAIAFERSVKSGEVDGWYTQRAGWACNVKAIIENRSVEPHELFDDHWWIGVRDVSFEEKVAWHKDGWDGRTVSVALRAGVTRDEAKGFDPKDPETRRTWEVLAALRN